MTSSPPDSALWSASINDQLRTVANVNSQVDWIGLDWIASTTAYKNRVISLMKFYVGLGIADDVNQSRRLAMNAVMNKLSSLSRSTRLSSYDKMKRTRGQALS